ncbi:AAA family ATPase [Sphingomonas parapaucimobilis]|uniref:AAA family ATPase n=1 Tax=Sphingomonas parapaucimobilis TaxID=28213 RepID=UPI001427B810|nr:AAA family ATPase [Sphingomonas parapaucimobilis]
MIKDEWAEYKGDLPWLKLARFGNTRSDKGSLRTNANMQAISGIELDYDDGDISPARARAILSEVGIAALIFTTPSHMQPGKGNRWRILCPTSRDLDPIERERLVARINGLFDGAFDPASFTMSQSFYYGNVEDGTPVQTYLVDGGYIDHADDLDEVALGRDGKPYRERREREANDNHEGATRPQHVADSALMSIPNEGDRSWWRDMAAAHKSAGGSFTVFDGWSKGHDSYSRRHTRDTWDDLDPEKEGGITERSLYSAAADHDWRDSELDEQTLADLDDYDADLEALIKEDKAHAAERQKADDSAFLKPVSSFASKRVPKREWLIPDLIPNRQVTDLSGDGGTGKSNLALQLAVAVGTGSPFLGERVDRPGAVCVIAAEDEEDELHRRFADICRERNLDMADLDNVWVRSMAGENAILAEPTRSGGLKETAIYERLERIMSERHYSLLILDTRSHLYGGEANNTNQVTQFINMLKHLAIQYDCAVLLLSHPSLTGMNTGTGSGFSVAWNNAVRSRLYLERVRNDDGTEDDTDARVLRTMKSNYGPTGGEIRMTWRRGVFVADAELADDDDDGDSRLPVDNLFLEILDAMTEQGRYVSHNTGPTYAPSLFEGHPRAGHTKNRTFKNAMERLLDAGEIVIAEHGKGNSKRTHLERASSQPPTGNRRRNREIQELV